MKRPSVRVIAAAVATAVGLAFAAPCLFAWFDSIAMHSAVRAATSTREIVEALEDHDLEHLMGDERRKAFAALREIAGKDYGWSDSTMTPHRVYRWSSGVTRWVLLVTAKGMRVPGMSFLAVHLFDADWRPLAVHGFPTGYRIALFDTWKDEIEGAGGSVIVVRLGSIGSFGDHSTRLRQYYVIREERVMLARIEEEGGGVLSGVFSTRTPMTGPELPDRTAGEWIASLDNADPALVLETLTWLGGRHLDSRLPREEGGDDESVADSRLFETVLDDPRAGQRLSELATSANSWIREAAAFASRQRSAR